MRRAGIGLVGAVACAVLAGEALGPLVVSGQTSDLDRLMERVVSRRDDNWTRLRQYVLEENETLRVVGPSGAPVYGFTRDHAWFIKEGIFVRSPLRADGVPIGDAERRAYEDEWIRDERRRLVEEQAAEAERAADVAAANERNADATLGAVLDRSMQPRFVSAAYFLEFEFDPGQYALVGRETLDGREVLRVEYYPTKLFDEGRTRPNRRARARDPNVESKLNKATLVTLWIDPEAEQIRRYTAEGIDWSFLPGRYVVQVDEVFASMNMREAFPGVWLPDTIEMRFSLGLAFGEVTGLYRVRFHDYRLADVTSTIRPGRR